MEIRSSLNANSHPASFWSMTVSWICAGVAMFLVLSLHLLDALLAGLLVYELVHLLAPALQKRFTNERSRIFAVAALAVFTVAILALSKAGARDPKLMSAPGVKEQDWIRSQARSISQITIAPELPGALELIDAATRLGLAMSAGHTEASDENMRAAATVGRILREE